MRLPPPWPRRAAHSRRYLGGLYHADSGHLHLLNYALGLARAAHEAGVSIYEDTCAVFLKKTAGGHEVQCANGQVEARYVVLACNAWLGQLAPGVARKILPVATYVVATESLGEERAHTVAHIVDLMKDEGEVTQYRVPRGLLLAGNPVQTLEHRFLSPCGQFSCGFWESTEGLWTVDYDEAEYCEMLGGVCVVRDAQGGEKVLRAGDRFVIPPGFRGTWEVVEPCRKVFVSYAQKAPEPQAQTQAPE